MNITRADLKAEAKKRLAPQTKTSVIATLVSYLVPTVFLPSGIGTVLLDGPFSSGIAQYFLRLIRGETPGIGTIFQGFTKFLRNIRLWALQVVFVLLWSLLLVVPGIIAALRYSLVWFVAADEPDLTALQALERSKALTKGRLKDLFGLYVSFFWWICLGAITLGIGFLWIIPYIQTTLALFYEGTKAAEASAPGRLN